MKLFDIPTESDMMAFGRDWIGQIDVGSIVFLSGDLGAGKTTLVRGMLDGLGHEGPVKSPTYTLIEPYEFAAMTVFHFDLYRITHPDELELIGIRDLINDRSICVFEWPDRGMGVLPNPTHQINILQFGAGRRLQLIEGGLPDEAP